MPQLFRCHLHSRGAIRFSCKNAHRSAGRYFLYHVQIQHEYIPAGITATPFGSSKRVCDGPPATVITPALRNTGACGIQRLILLSSARRHLTPTGATHTQRTVGGCGYRHHYPVESDDVLRGVSTEANPLDGYFRTCETVIR